jgi:hypothetical protein
MKEYLTIRSSLSAHEMMPTLLNLQHVYLEAALPCRLYARIFPYVGSSMQALGILKQSRTCIPDMHVCVHAGGSIIGGLGIGLLSLLLFKHKPHAMVGLSVGLQVSKPVQLRHDAGRSPGQCQYSGSHEADVRAAPVTSH